MYIPSGLILSNVHAKLYGITIFSSSVNDPILYLSPTNY